MTSSELALKFLNGRQSAWLSVKQTAWLRDLIIQETRNDRPSRLLYLPFPVPVNTDDGTIEVSYQLAKASNGAGLLKPVPTSRS